MLWFVLILVVAIIAALWFWNSRRDQEWRRELLYLTRHEGSVSNKEGVSEAKPEKLDVAISPILQSARHHAPRGLDLSAPIDDYQLDEADNIDLDQDDGLYDLPIFAQNAEETKAAATSFAQVSNTEAEYFYPESVSVPFDEQFEPIFPKKNLDEPEVVVLNTQLAREPLSPEQESSDALPVIELNDIRHHLKLKKTTKKRQRPQSDAQQVLPIIDDAEVWANLAKTDSPAPKVYAQRNMLSDSVIPVSARIAGSYGQILTAGKDGFSKSNRAPISTRFTPFSTPTETTSPAVSNVESDAQAGLFHQPPVSEAIPVLSRVVAYEPETAMTLIEEEPAPLQAAYTPLEQVAERNTYFVPEVPDVETDFVFTPAYDEEDLDTELGLEERMPLGSMGSALVTETITLVDTPKVAEPTVQAPLQNVAAPSVAPALVTTSAVVPYTSYGSDFLPSLNLLHPPDPKSSSGLSDDALLENGIVIEEKLAEFKVKVSVVEAYAGPVVTRYEIEPAVGVRGSQVVNLVKDLARALGFISIRVVETIPGKTCMGLELPNPKRQIIRLSEILSDPIFTDSRSKLTLALGQDITGQPIVTDLAKAPHLLVAGTTGSGKSVGVNAMILSLLYKATPDEVRLIMIDPKMLELSIYEGIPHLLAPVVTDMKLAANALTWCVNEMDKRYRLMSYFGVRNIAGFNQKLKEALDRGQKLGNPFSLTPETPEPLEHLPYIVVVVDEFADLMMVAGKKIEELIARLAQKARAAGIHLILATQRPSVDVITGLIKANIPTRIAFQVSSKIDSRTILDQMGAESLLGQGDMLFLPPGTGYPQRVHGAFVADDEVHRIVTHLKQFGEPNYVADILTSGVGEDDLFSNATAGKSNPEDDPLYDEAVSIVVRTRKASISSVQRQLRIGYNRAARLIEQMEAAGVVSPMENNGNRTVLAPDRGMD